MMTLATSCFQQATSGKRTSNSYVSNTPNSVSAGYGRILDDNPIILSGNDNLAVDTSLDRYLTIDQEFISDSQFLEGDCLLIENCMSARMDVNESPLQSTTKKWAFTTSTDEFLQVQTFGHIKRVVDRYLGDMETHFEVASGGLQYPTALPDTLKSTQSYWKKNTTLTGYSHCDFANNASFSPATFELCMGYSSVYPDFKLAEDNTVIYHEVGHGLVDIMMNMRNQAYQALDSSFVVRSDLGVVSYDEAGAINEGIADFFSYYMNYRTHIGEWGLGRVFYQSRPMSEDDPLHAAGISTSTSERLSYPTYLDYDPNDKNSSYEDIHYAGQIMSHYLVAQTKSIESACNIPLDKATRFVMNNINETLSELGDLTAKGSDHYPSGTHVNLNSTYSKLMVDALKPIDYRSFSQTFGKNILRTISSLQTGSCTKATYQDTLEQLLDSYGLLLFKNFNESMNGENGTGLTDTKVTLANRKKTELVSKSVIKIDDRLGKNGFYVSDKQSSLYNVLTSFLSSGKITSISPQIDDVLGYNNGNGKISPGEFVGIHLNLFNNSNSIVSGVRVVASDWAHFYKDTTQSPAAPRPCNIDNFPKSTGATASDLDQNNSCADLTFDEMNPSSSDNADFLDYKLYPSCMVQLNEESETRWASQEDFRENHGLDESKCLDPSDTKSCYIRIPRGVDQAWYSKIEPNKTWAEVFKRSDGSPLLDTGNLIFMEVSPHIPHGTTFNCRLRVSFTNCSDCHDDGNNDLKDSHYMEDDPFKVINFQFTVLD
ncbi:hypothetical protein HBN50_04410 [Halobacteriovorax sp. GB3]|uniref:hypothetical protein n=1 Tax=Halobacteriovorax sp. GB3 TaxID=2719615 RepID=UPI002362667D|nr:hypothetical protein [Halobacteriovorax sp. GB3]MDD0852325.1 hypothetical protein [Halobacteriovorax sp. GB3]